MGSVISKLLEEEREYRLPRPIENFNMESVIKWQTGEPKESGAYLATIKGRYSIFVQYAQFGCLTGWSYFKPEEILAWCKLSDIEPYKEEKE